MTYTYLSADLASGALIAELPFVNVKWGRQLNGAGTFAGLLPQRPPIDADSRLLNALHADATENKRRAIYVLRDEAALACYYITARRWNVVTQAWEVKGAELPAYLGERLFGAAGSAAARAQLFTYGPDTPVGVALAILEDYAAGFALDTSGVIPPSIGPEVTAEGRLLDGKFVAEVITDLSDGEGDLGFDWRIDLARTGPGTFARRLVMAPTLGGDVGLIAKLTRADGRGNITDATISFDERRANLVVALGQGDGAARASAEAVNSLAEPRVARVITFSDEPSDAVLASRAAAELRTVENPEILEIALRSDHLDAEIGTFVPGDVGNVVIEPGTDARYPDGIWLERRITGYDVTVPNEQDAETIKFELDEPVGEFA